jgi:hypothetical protein
MISCQEYQMLDELLQVELIKVDGAYLMHRKTENLKVELFALYGFYVEVFYSKSESEPLYFKSFERDKDLNIYLERIIIDGIFERL